MKTRISKEKMNSVRGFIAICLTISGLALTSKFDLEDQKVADANYCKMVNDGSWGEYRDDIKCENLQAAK